MKVSNVAGNMQQYSKNVCLLVPHVFTYTK